MRLPFIFSAVLALNAVQLVLGDGDVEPTEVINLTTESFDEFVDRESLALVEFFAPWCGHCKALAPEYAQASITLKAKGIPLAAVDCVDQSDLCQKHGVQGYPTLKVFRSGAPTEYAGPRKADGIVSYMIKQSLPAVTDVTTANFEEFKGADKLVLVAFASSATESPGPVFSQVAEKHRDDYLFGLTTDPAVAEAAGVTPPAIVLYRAFDEPVINFETSDVSTATAEAIEAFLKDNALPLVDEISAENYATYATAALPLAYLFVDPADTKREEHIEAIKPLAVAHKGAINFVWIDATKYGDHAKALNYDKASWPAFVIQDMKNHLKYPLEEFSLDSVATHVKDFAAKTLQPKLKSEPVPETQDESVYVLVGSKFDEVVYDDKKDVFVEFYAPWCGHCKRLKPTWDSLGDKYASLKDRITIAKMDATENDLPASAPFQVAGFPTLKFKPAGSREFVDYDGDRSLESLIEFVETHAKNDLTPPAEEKPATPSEQVVVETPVVEQHHIEL